MFTVLLNNQFVLFFVIPFVYGGLAANAQYLKMTPVEFIDKYGDVYIGDNSKIPLVSLEFQKKQSIVGEEYTVCPFRMRKDGSYLCSIHSAKPFVCLSYPLGRVTTYDDQIEKTHYILQEISCGDTTEEAQEFSLSSWFGEFNVKTNERFSKTFHSLAQQIGDIIDFDKIGKMAQEKTTTATVLEMYYDTIFAMMYLNIPVEPDVDIVKWTEEMVEEVLGKTEEFVHVLTVNGMRVKAKKYKLRPSYLKELEEKFQEAKRKNA